MIAIVNGINMFDPNALHPEIDGFMCGMCLTSAVYIMILANVKRID